MLAPVGGADAGLVALCVGEHPEAGGARVADERAARRDHLADPALGVLGRHDHVEVEALRRGRGRLRLLEPEGGQPAVGVDEPGDAGLGGGQASTAAQKGRDAWSRRGVERDLEHRDLDADRPRRRGRRASR